jgi:predicted GNAT family acetyltransferase
VALGMMSSLPVKVLGPPQVPLIAAMLDADPFAGCIVGARFDAHTRHNANLGGQFWGINGGRGGLCFVGPNLVPLTGDERALRAFAAMAARRPRHSASVCGRRELVMPLWDRLERRWGPARLIRHEQPFLVCSQPPAIPPDPLVRAARAEDLPTYYPAAVAMFTEEIGVDPTEGDSGRSYHHRVSELIRQGRSFVRYDGDQVVFKAEVGSLSDRAALIQGVWVAPGRRGEGIAGPAMAAVVRGVQDGMGRTPCLYVNDFNLAARAAYRRVGFAQIATYASVLF